MDDQEEDSSENHDCCDDSWIFEF